MIIILIFYASRFGTGSGGRHDWRGFMFLAHRVCSVLTEVAPAKCLTGRDTLGRLGLCGDQRAVGAAASKEGVMGALFHDSPFL